MTVAILRGDARQIPLPDGCVDLIVTSPPYFGLRSYTDGCPTCADVMRQKIPGYTERRCADCGNVEQGRMRCNRCGGRTVRTELAHTVGRADCPDCGGSGQRHYNGQIGSEATPQEWLAAMVACTREWVRVLKPEGSIFINLGDKYNSSVGGQQNGAVLLATRGKPRAAAQERATGGRRPAPGGAPPKSLLGLPWRYALRCMDELGLILRRDIIWAKPNGLPESVTDRCRSSHEYVFHMTKQARYYAAVDEIRTPAIRTDIRKPAAAYVAGVAPGQNGHTGLGDRANHPLGSLPGSVWSIPSQPLTVPPSLGVDHFAAFPVELPRRIVLGWSPPGVCTACGQGRRPVATGRYRNFAQGNDPGNRRRSTGALSLQSGVRCERVTTITGYECACPIHPPLVAPSAPTPPALVLDPFCGTGTTLLAAAAYGRNAIGIDRSADYCRLAQWRVNDPGERAKAMQVPKPPPVPDGMEALF